MQRIAIIGAGGHARVIASLIEVAAQAGQSVELAGFVAPAEGNHDGLLLGQDADLPSLFADGKFS